MTDEPSLLASALADRSQHEAYPRVVHAVLLLRCVCCLVEAVMLGLDCDYYRRGCLSLFCASAVQVQRHSTAVGGSRGAGPGLREESERVPVRSTMYRQIRVATDVVSCDLQSPSTSVSTAAVAGITEEACADTGCYRLLHRWHLACLQILILHWS